MHVLERHQSFSGYLCLASSVYANPRTCVCFVAGGESVGVCMHCPHYWKTAEFPHSPCIHGAYLDSLLCPSER